MAIPGAIMFTLAGITGQLVLNGLDRWRVQYIYDHEDEWAEAARLKELQKLNSTEGREMQNAAIDRAMELDQKFRFLDGLAGFAGLRSKGTGERKRMLVEEIEKLDGKIRKVDEEIEALERTMEKGQEGEK